jgi:hypothetical protein
VLDQDAPPHPVNALCYQHRSNIDVGYQGVDRSLHVNAEVDF